ncbi:MAG: flagellar export protein FliJ [Lachnospiraceae bacterium]|nr:flagellar export protein FliJ [Lachnospiraceae bacterium]MCI9150258.1 flagellar export protein FliJ [Lachnospiraceae bacterium]
MAGFHYKMQNILNIKYKLESQAKIAFAAAAAALAQEEEKLRLLRVRRMEYEEQARALRTELLDIPRINQCQQAVDAMKELIRRQQVSVHVAQRNLEMMRSQLNEVMKDRKTHEKLRENALEEFKHELASQEIKEIDQLVSYTYQGRTAE